MELIEEARVMNRLKFSPLQHRIYDKASLKVDLATAGLRLILEGGYLLNPITHTQI